MFGFLGCGVQVLIVHGFVFEKTSSRQRRNRKESNTSCAKLGPGGKWSEFLRQWQRRSARCSRREAMGDADAGEKKARLPDQRIPWAAILLNTREEKLERFLELFFQDDTSCKSLLRFLDDLDATFVFFHPAGESCTANATEFPTAAQLKKKVIVMHRVRPEIELTDANIADSVVILELTMNNSQRSESFRGLSLFSGPPCGGVGRANPFLF